MKNPEELAKYMHEEYERIAKKKGWHTQDKCKVPFSKLPKKNREVMIELAEILLDSFHIAIKRSEEIGIQYGRVQMLDDFRHFCLEKINLEMR